MADAFNVIRTIDESSSDVILSTIMGQQQLIFLILSTLLVAGATTVGLSMFSDQQEAAAYDAITTEAMNVLSRTIAWKHRPATMGGGKSIQYLKGMTFSDIGFEATNGAGTKANDDDFKRTLKGLNSKRPYFRIQHGNQTSIRIDLFMYGTESNCLKLRKAKKIDGKWINSGLKVGKNNPPDGCPVW